MGKTGDHTNSGWFASALDSSMDSETESSSSDDENDEDDSASEDD
jgi:hypothetical protein